MKKRKSTTPWFSSGTRPTRIGWYQTKVIPALTRMKYWDGRIWLYLSGSGLVRSRTQDPAWRGLTESAYKRLLRLKVRFLSSLHAARSE